LPPAPPPAPPTLPPAAPPPFGPPDPDTLPPSHQGSYRDPAATGWTPQLSPLSLPSPGRLLTEGIDILTHWHPRDPELRMGVPNEVEPATPGAKPEPSTAAAADPARPDASADGGTQSDAARIAMYVGIGGGFLQNAIDVVRTIKKYPEALRAAKFDPALGPLGRLPTALGLTAMTRPDNRIINPAFKGLAASVATGGRTFDHFDEIAMKTSVLLGAGMAAIQIGASIPNLMDALQKDGPWYENLAGSTSGRAGVLQLAGGTIGAAVFATALKQTAATVRPGAGIVERVVAAGSAPVAARPIWGRIGMASGALVAANMLGYFDFLNKGETRSVREVLSDAAHRTPVLNDPQFRSAALLGAGGVVSFKIHRAIASGGGLAGVKAGHWIAGAAVAGLLGAQLLGGLAGLDKPVAG